MNRITERIAYKEAGRKLRLSRQRLADSHLRANGRAWRVWAACAELTASYSKNAERTTVVEIAALAGVRPDKASPLLREFDRLGVFTWRKDRGRRSPGLLVLPAMGPEAGAHSPPMGPRAGSNNNPELGPYLEGEEEDLSGPSRPSEDGAPERCSMCGGRASLAEGLCGKCWAEWYTDGRPFGAAA